MSRGFAAKTLEAMRTDVERAAREIIGSVADKGECDFVTEVAALLPLRIVNDMLGIPRSEEQFIFEQTNVLMAASDPEYVSDQTPRGVARAVAAAGERLARLMQGLAQDRIKSPRDDLISVLVAATAEETLTPDELAAFFILLVGAGNETTRNAISHGLLALTQFPSQRALWQSDPDAYTPRAVEELVRWASPVLHMRRTVTRDGVRLGEQEFAQGDKVVLWYRSANQDEEYFTNPTAFDITRDQPARHLRLTGTTSLPGREPGPAGADGRVPHAAGDAPRHPGHWRSRAAAVQLPARHQAPARRVHPRAERRGAGVSADRAVAAPSGDTADPEAAVLVSDSGGIRRITLNRPEAANALRPVDRDRITELLGEADADPAIRVVVLTAHGRHFCSGADVGGIARSNSGDKRVIDGMRKIMNGAQLLIAAVLDCGKPVVAAVNGTAAGIGVHLALAADLVVASEEASFIEVFVRRGLVVDGGGAYLLPRLIGMHKAKELAFFGDKLPAAEALALGLVNQVVPAAELDAAANEYARRLAAAPTSAISLTKRLLNASPDSDRAQAFLAEAMAQEIQSFAEDSREGIRSFVERRPPEFRGW